MRGEPIVSSPSDALKTFAASGIDYLVLEDFVVEKQDDSPSSTNAEHALAGYK